jgi:hypothetical protein
MLPPGVSPLSVSALNQGAALIHPSPNVKDRLPRLARLDKDQTGYHTTAGKKNPILQFVYQIQVNASPGIPPFSITI